ncbi:MAG: TonB-dependent receptor [Bacteroidota bacterium]|jgi:hypothetical protein|nr:TonB-dependent receptor [Bacteroidota bacterium]
MTCTAIPRRPALLLIVALLLTVSLSGTDALLAQEKPVPPPRDFTPETKQVRDVLPALTLPEYVITGSDMIAFTEDRKTAATAPDSREFTARAGRGMRERRFFGTAPTRMPLRHSPLTGSAEVLRLRAGYGGFATPLLEGWYADRYARGDAAAHVFYEKTDGHVRYADRSDFVFDLAGGTYLPRHIHPLLASSRLQGDLAVEARSYGLYADKLPVTSPAFDFRRTAFGLAAGMDVISRRNAVLDHSLRLSVEHYAVEERFSLRDSLTLDAYEHIENRFGVDATAETRVLSREVSLGFSARLTGLSEDSPQRNAPLFLHADAATVFPLAEATRLETTAALYVFRGSDHAAQLRFYPSLTLRQRFGNDWSAYAGWQPTVIERSLRGFLRTNPYLMLASQVRHTDAPLRFELGAEFDDRQASSARVGLSFLSSTSWARFSLLPDPVRQQWELRYDDRATILTLHAALQHAFSTHTRIQAGMDLRTSALEESGGPVPYLPDYTLRTLLSHEFPFGLRLQPTVELVGEQKSDGGSLPAFLLLGFDVEYRLLRNLGLFLRFDNLLDQHWERWPGYRERPFFMMGGITAHF